MQAHANDLRAEVAYDWSSLTGAQPRPAPGAAALDEFVHQAVDDWRRCGLSAPVARLAQFAEKVTRAPAGLGEADVVGLRQAGWSDRAIHDAVQVVAYFNYVNRLADALGVAPEEGLPRWGRT